MEIVTSRLVLREYKLNDFDSFWEMINDPTVKKYTGGVTELSYDERLEIFKEDIRQGFTDEVAEFAVALRSSGEYIGYCGFRYSEALKGNEILYGYRQKAWGQGFGHEAAFSVLHYLFGELRCDRYVALAVADNAASVRILLKLGFKKVCTECENGGKVDLYEIYREDFQRCLRD